MRNIRFNNGRGYFFAFNRDGTFELHPIHPELEGQNLRTGQNNLGQFVVEDALRSIDSEGEGFYSYTWSKPNETGKNHSKLAFLKYLPELDWIIGAGVYIDEIDTLIAENQQLFKDKVIEHAKIMALVLLVLLLINYVTASYISRSIWKQIELFSHFFRKASTKSTSIDSKRLTYSEFQEIGRFANIMLEQRDTYLHELSESRDKWTGENNDYNQQPYHCKGGS